MEVTTARNSTDKLGRNNLLADSSDFDSTKHLPSLDKRHMFNPIINSKSSFDPPEIVPTRVFARAQSKMEQPASKLTLNLGKQN